MPLCAILGDSLAAGVATYRPDCIADTKVGITSAAYIATHTMAVRTDTALISLGVNDGPPTIGTMEHLVRLRQGSPPAKSIGSCRPVRMERAP